MEEIQREHRSILLAVLPVCIHSSNMPFLLVEGLAKPQRRWWNPLGLRDLEDMHGRIKIDVARYECGQLISTLVTIGEKRDMSKDLVFGSSSLAVTYFCKAIFRSARLRKIQNLL